MWDPYTTTNIMRLQKVPRKATRFVYGVYCRAISPTTLCANAEVETPEERWRANRLNYFYLIVNDQLRVDRDKYTDFFCPGYTSNEYEKKIRPYSSKNDTFTFSLVP